MAGRTAPMRSTFSGNGGAGLCSGPVAPSGSTRKRDFPTAARPAAARTHARGLESGPWRAHTRYCEAATPPTPLISRNSNTAHTLFSSGIYPRECPFPASRRPPDPYGSAQCPRPFPCRAFEQTSDIRTPVSSAGCTPQRIRHSTRHVGPTRWRAGQEDGSKTCVRCPHGMPPTAWSPPDSQSDNPRGARSERE